MLNEGVVGSVAAVGDLGVRGAGALYSGVQTGAYSAMTRAGVPTNLARDIVSIPEAFAGSPRMVMPPQVPGRATLRPEPPKAEICRGCRPPPRAPVAPPITVPEGATVLRRGGPSGEDWVIYRMPTGPDRIRFRASEARTLREPNGVPGAVNSTEAEAGLSMGPTSSADRAWVFEGRHRAVGAANGDVIPEHMGGVPGQPGVLDYEFFNQYARGTDGQLTTGVRVGDLRNPTR